MLQLHIERFGGLDLYKVKDTESAFSAAFIPDAGGLLNEVMADVKGKPLSILEGYKDADDLLKNNSLVFKSAKLSPYPNRIANGRYAYEGKSYQLEKNFVQERNSIHGLVYNKPFFVEKAECTGDKAELTFSYKYNKDDDGYSFRYKLYVKYLLEKNIIHCETTIQNLDQYSIPMGDGWHPYFSLGKRINDLHLLLPSCEKLQEEKLIPTGESTPFSNFSTAKNIGDEHFDTCFKLDEKLTRAEIKLSDLQNNYALSFWQENGNRKYKYFQLYTPLSRNCIAIEPMTCPPDAFNSKKDLILLEPREQIILSYGFEINAF